MNRKRVVVTTLLAAALAAIPVTADAVTPTSPDADVPVTTMGPPPGFTLCDDINLRGNCQTWGAGSPNTLPMGTQALSAVNNLPSETNHDVWVFHDVDYRGARRGIYHGVALNDLRKYTYDGQTYHLARNIRSFVPTGLNHD